MLGSGGDFKKQAWPSIDGLCYLALYTYLVRTTRRTLGSEIGIIKTPTKGRNLLKTLWSSKHKKDLKWKKTLFNRDPFDESSPYLTTSGSDSMDSFEIWIPQDVEIELIEAHFETTILTNELKELANRLALDSHQKPPRLSIELKMNDFCISSSTCTGFLTRGHRFQLLINWNFLSTLFACWIDSENKIEILFPDSSLTYTKHPFDFSTSKEKSSLAIPTYEELVVQSPPGLESCLILSTKGILTGKMKTRIVSHLEQSLTLRDNEKKIAEPNFKILSLDKARQNPGKRIEIAATPDDWESEIAFRMKEFFDSAYIFHIPNR